MLAGLSPEQAIRQGSRSFALASIFLPASSREQAYLLYQWCRNSDDLIDEAPDLPTARQRLALLENPDESQQHLKPPSWVEPRHRDDFLAGLRMDVDKCRYESLTDLELYCYRVAGVVGLMMCPVIGADPEKAPAHAAALGKAMQLTNIARDIQTDARMGRVYVPEQLLPDASAPKLAQEPELALPAVTTLLSVADQWYEEGLKGIRFLPMKTAFAIAVAGKVYQAIGHKLLRKAARNPAAAWRHRTVVSWPEKLLAVVTAGLLVIQVKFSGAVRS
jgi:phytoene synthase